MRVIYMGTPDFAVPALDALAAAGHEIVAVYSQPPRPAGRGKKPQLSPVHARAEVLDLPVRTPVSLNDAEEQAAFAALDADIAVVAAYGLILPRALLDAARLGCLNIHASLLPRWRGAAPIQRAILAGDSETGVTIMKMEAGLDTGPMLARRAVPVGDYDSTGVLTDRLALLGAAMMVEVLADITAFPPVLQPGEGITYAAKIAKEEARIDFSAGAVQVHRQIRAFNPAPGAWFEHAGERVRILSSHIQSAPGDPGNVEFATTPGLVLDGQLAIGCGTGAIRPDMVQRAGRGVMTAQDLLRGFAIPAGTKLE